MVELGLTCREAYTIFSQNETLRLQKENAQLKAKLKKFEFPKQLREFVASPTYYVKVDEVHGKIKEFILQNIPLYISTQDHEDWIDDKIFDVLIEYGFGIQMLADFIAKHINILSGCMEFSTAQGMLLAKHINQILLLNYAVASEHDDMLIWEANSTFLEDAWGIIYCQFLITIGFDQFAAVENDLQ